MNRLTIRRCGLALIGVLCLTSAGQAQIWQRPPIKVNTVFDFRVDVSVGPQIQRPTAPWYAYFPADPNMQPSPQATPFPPWPMQFPPPAPPADALQKQNAQTQRATGPMQTSYGSAYSTYPVQPVGFVPTQAPSYWYQQR
jgi:hypothetical protein